MGFVRSGLNRELNERNQHINPIEGGGADLPPLSRICVYGSDSPGREFWPKCGTFLKKVEPSCDQT